MFVICIKNYKSKKITINSDKKLTNIDILYSLIFNNNIKKMSYNYIIWRINEH